MNYVAFSFLAIFLLPFAILIGNMAYRQFFEVPPLPVGMRLIRLGNRWAFQYGTYLSRFLFLTKRGAALHAIEYLQKLSRL